MLQDGLTFENHEGLPFAGIIFAEAYLLKLRRNLEKWPEAGYICIPL